VPAVIAYQIWVYRIFHDPAAFNEGAAETESY
jgi:cytochrome bd-type quinol oxidase subunit 2